MDCSGIPKLIFEDKKGYTKAIHPYGQGPLPPFCVSFRILEDIMGFEEHPLKGRIGKNANRWKGGISYSYCKKIYRKKAEKALGKPLDPKHPVHHHDKDVTNNSNGNLVLCEDNTYHLFLHQRTRAYYACGHPNWRKCSVCKEYDTPDNLYIVKNGNSAFHRSCRAELARKKRRSAGL